MTLEYHVVDVFAEMPFTGNPLAVVLDADDLSTEAMQAIALEFNLSETTFPVRPTQAGADYLLRIFTPSTELPFAGHPSVGTAWLLHDLGRLDTGRAVQQCGAGLLPVEIRADGATLTGGRPAWEDPLDPGPLLAAVGLAGGDADAPPPRRAGSGLMFTYLPVRPDAVAHAVPNPGELVRLGHSEMYVFAYDVATGQAHARMFGAGVGVAEDPATGSAALGLGVWLAVSGLVPADGTTAYEVRQGVEMNRPSLLSCTVTTESGAVVRTTVSGRVHPVARGHVARP